MAKRSGEMARTGRSYRNWSIVLWLFAIWLTVHTTPRTVRLFDQWRQTRAETHQLQRELEALRQQERELQAQLERARTDLGRESLARQRGWLRKGEQPLRINP
ncbi:MAG: hypothetical protein RMK45_03715 [Armatimonadota bacterium]|nr:hypothetical protein [Armatimonadota bacterium]